MNRTAIIVVVGIVLLIIGMVSFSTSSSIDPCEKSWKSHESAYLYQHNVDDTDSSAVSDAHDAFINDCKDGVPQ